MLRLFSLAFAVVVLGAGLILASPGASATGRSVARSRAVPLD